MKLIIAGSRTFGSGLSDFDCMESNLLDCVGKVDEIVSGTARGADSFGEIWARMHNVPIKKFRPDWDADGKRAGILRNQQMADYADEAFVFWDGKSKGSKNMIEEMKKRGKPVHVVLTGVKPAVGTV